MKIKMKIKMTGLIMGIALVILLSSSAYAITIDGDLSDWGVTPGAYGVNPLLWIPSISGIFYTIEDTKPSTYFQDPGYGYQLFDAEAAYLTYDATNLYFAIVTGHPAGGADGHYPGDIAFDFGSDGSYEYGVETVGGSFTQGALYSVATWGQGLNNWGYGNIGYVSAPTTIKTINGSGPLGLGSLAYNNTYYGDNASGNHWVIEGSVAIEDFPFAWTSNTPFTMHWTQTCGNDFIDLYARTAPVPEPATMALFGLGALGLGWVRKRRVR